ncbi:MAG: hypothetical protein Q8P13_04315 [bacterium]|nr:hypothetical protein [bacterium]
MPKPSEPIPETTKPESSKIPTTGSPEIVETYPQIEALNEFSKTLQNEVKTLSDKQNDILKEFNSQEDRVKKVEDKLDENRTQLIETLGLFVALFTFISIEFSLFKQVTVFSAAVSLTLISAGLLTFFVLLLHVVLRTGKNAGSIVIYIVLTLLIIGLIFFGINFNNFYSKGNYLINTATSSAIQTPK